MKQKWTTKDFHRVHKVRQKPVALMYKASTLLLNVAPCLYEGRQIGHYFKVEARSKSQKLLDERLTSNFIRSIMARRSSQHSSVSFCSARMRPYLSCLFKIESLLIQLLLSFQDFLRALEALHLSLHTFSLEGKAFLVKLYFLRVHLVLPPH